MTNAEIIFNTSVKLMQDGIIKGSGKFATLESGELLELPESIHTYAAWQTVGRQVKRGEKCKARFCIWKAGKTGKSKAKPGEASGNDENDDQKQAVNASVRMFMKEAFFFTFDQTEPIKAKA